MSEIARVNRITGDFATGPQTRLIAIKVVRVPAIADQQQVLVRRRETHLGSDRQRPITRHRAALPMPVNVSQTTAASRIPVSRSPGDGFTCTLHCKMRKPAAGSKAHVPD